MDDNVKNEVLQDLIFCIELNELKNKIENEAVKKYYTQIEIEWLSIVMHECIQSKLIDKNTLNKTSQNILREVRQRILKTAPSENSKTIQNIVKDMGINYNHFAYDIVLTVNNNDNNLFGVNFSHWDIQNKFSENIDMYEEILKITYASITYILDNHFKDNKESFKKNFDRYNEIIAERISSEIQLQCYSYASSVFFKSEPMKEYDKYILLYYYTPLYQGYIIDKLVPNIGENQNEGDIGCIETKAKYRALIIESFGEIFKHEMSPLILEINDFINDFKPGENFFKRNRKIRNNIHYQRKTLVTKEEIYEIYRMQSDYFEGVLNIFNSHIKYKFGTKYKFLRWLAFNTDSTILNIRKNNKNITCYEDITQADWKDAEQRLKKKDT